jgi:hypothetical protein
MDWIEKRLKQIAARALCHKQIAAGADSLWNQVCETIDAALKAYQDSEDRPRDAFFVLRKSDEASVAVREKGNEQAIERDHDRVHFRLNKATRTIATRTIATRTIAVGDKRNEKTFALDCDEVGRILLKDDDKRVVSVEKLVELVLDPVLFPAPQESSSTLNALQK